MDKNKKEIYHKAKKAFVEIDYLRLDMIDDYNCGIVGVDVAYQLHLQYRVESWICQRKWWWSFFL